MCPSPWNWGKRGTGRCSWPGTREGREARASAPPGGGRPPAPAPGALPAAAPQDRGAPPSWWRRPPPRRKGHDWRYLPSNALRREALLALLAPAGAAGSLCPSRRRPWIPLPTPGPGGSGCRCGPASAARTRCRPRPGGAGKSPCPSPTPVKDLERLGEEGLAPPSCWSCPGPMFGAEERIRGLMEERMAGGFMDFTCGNLGAVALCRELGARAHGTFSLNIANTPGPGLFPGAGVTVGGVLLRAHRPGAGGPGWQPAPGGAMVYGRQALMLTRNCPLANSPKGCLGCKSPGCLTDRKRKRFPVVCARLGRGAAGRGAFEQRAPVAGGPGGQAGEYGFRGVPVHGGKTLWNPARCWRPFFDRNP